MRRGCLVLLSIVLLLPALLPSAARGAGCAPLACGVGTVSVDGGRALVIRPVALGGYGWAVAVDVARGRVARKARLPDAGPNVWPAVAAGRTTVAVAAATRISFLDARTLRVRRVTRRVGIAIAFSPDGRRLWALGERSRIGSVAVPAA